MRKITLLIILCFASVCLAGLKPIVLDSSYQHDKFDTQPKDQVRHFRAYTTSFDGTDDEVALGIPEWVSYEMRAEPNNFGSPPGRPSKWFTDDELNAKGIAPNDDTYKNSGHSRGHMCMKHHAWRLGEAADWNTHTVLNACPQLQGLNAGSWLQLEELTGEWANRYGKIWIICGPVFLSKSYKWIGDAGEIPAAIPDAFYKIVVREANTIEVLAFVFPHEGHPSLNTKTGDLKPYLTSVDVIEALTGLNFLTALDDDIEKQVERMVAVELW